MAGRPRSRDSSSSFTAIRTAWKMRALSRAVGDRPSVTASAATRSSLVSRASVARRFTISRARRRAFGSSPKSRKTCASLSSLASARKRTASRLDDSSIRISNATPRRNVKPRASDSSCRELTPRSSSAPSRPTSRASASVGASSKRQWRKRTRGEKATRAARACSMASASRSTARTRQPPHASRIRRVWDPPPNVPSI
jgi:hypothetical protein